MCRILCLIEIRNPSWDRCGARAARPEKNLLGFCHAHPHVFLIYILEGTWLQGLAGCRCHCGVGGSVKCDCHIASPYPPPGFLEGAQWVRISAVVSNLRLKSLFESDKVSINATQERENTHTHARALRHIHTHGFEIGGNEF